MMARAKYFLDFDAIEYFNSIITALTNYACDGADDIEGYLVKKQGYDKDAVSKALQGVLRKIEGSIDRNFDKFELYCMRNILKIPDELDLTEKLPKIATLPEEEPMSYEQLQEAATELNDAFSDKLEHYADSLRRLREAEGRVQYLNGILELISRSKLKDKETAREFIAKLKDVGEVAEAIPTLLEKFVQGGGDVVLDEDISMIDEDFFETTFADQTLIQDERVGFFVGDAASLKDAGIALSEYAPQNSFFGIKYETLQDLTYVVDVLRNTN